MMRGSDLHITYSSYGGLSDTQRFSKKKRRESKWFKRSGSQRFVQSSVSGSALGERNALLSPQIGLRKSMQSMNLSFHKTPGVMSPVSNGVCSGHLGRGFWNEPSIRRHGRQQESPSLQGKTVLIMELTLINKSFYKTHPPLTLGFRKLR